MAVQYMHQINLTDIYIKKQTSHTVILFLIKRNKTDINLINNYSQTCRLEQQINFIAMQQREACQNKNKIK